LSKTDLNYDILKDISILLVDDNESELEELCELCSVYFKVCYSAVDGKDGLNKFIKYSPDIVLTDYGMPIMDGLDMSRELRELDQSIPIVLHTVFSQTNTFLKAIKCKISSYIVKPTSAKSVLDTLLAESLHILEKRELKKKDFLMRSILEQLPEPIIVTDLEQNVIFADNKVKNNGFWQKDKLIKCHKALYGFDNLCDNPNHRCDSLEASNLGHSIVRTHEIIEKNGEKKYQDIKTIPLKDKNGKVYAFLKSIRDRTDEKERELALQHIVNHDILTGLPNRMLLDDRLNQAIQRSDREKNCFAVMFVDFDGFKNINDTFGHKAGDKVLIEASLRMQKSIRKIDTIARLGGDEFIVVLEGLSNKKKIKNIANDILKRLRCVFDIDSAEINMTCSIGIDIYNPLKNKKSKENLLENADYAMIKAKNLGKNRFEFINE